MLGVELELLLDEELESDEGLDSLAAGFDSVAAGFASEDEDESDLSVLELLDDFDA